MRRHIAVFLMVIMVFSLAACSTTKEPSDGNVVEENKNNVEENIEDNTIEEEENEEVEPPATANEEEVTLYFANNDYIETGDENLEKLIAEKRIVKYGDLSLEETVVKELIKGPENDKLSTVIPPNIKLLSVEVLEETAFVNFAQENLYGGSMQEDFTLEQIVGSLIELDSVEKVQFLIDGEKAESLMGHFDISEPFEKIMD